VQVGLKLIVPAYPLTNLAVQVRVPGFTVIVGGKYIFI